VGATGAGSFENDDAMDWASDLSASSDWSVVEGAFARVLNLGPDDYLEAPEAAVALAAAEVVAAAVDAPAQDLPGAVTQWLETHRDDVSHEHASDASESVKRVAGNSELLDLWTQTGDPSDWRSAVADLQNRLAGAHRSDDL
jgi:hypothetical protein